ECVPGQRACGHGVHHGADARRRHRHRGRDCGGRRDRVVVVVPAVVAAAAVVVHVDVDALVDVDVPVDVDVVVHVVHAGGADVVGARVGPAVVQLPAAAAGATAGCVGHGGQDAGEGEDDQPSREEGMSVEVRHACTPHLSFLGTISTTLAPLGGTNVKVASVNAGLRFQVRRLTD